MLAHVRLCVRSSAGLYGSSLYIGTASSLAVVGRPHYRLERSQPRRKGSQRQVSVAPSRHWI
jgi:hypothetical protein